MDASSTESFVHTINSVLHPFYGSSLYGVEGNLLLEDTIERYYVDLEWADEAHGMFLVRGENVVLLGEIVH